MICNYKSVGKNKDVESSECRKYRNWVIADQELENYIEKMRRVGE